MDIALFFLLAHVHVSFIPFTKLNRLTWGIPYTTILSPVTLTLTQNSTLFSLQVLTCQQNLLVNLAKWMKSEKRRNRKQAGNRQKRKRKYIQLLFSSVSTLIFYFSYIMHCTPTTTSYLPRYRSYLFLPSALYLSFLFNLHDVYIKEGNIFIQLIISSCYRRKRVCSLLCYYIICTLSPSRQSSYTPKTHTFQQNMYRRLLHVHNSLHYNFSKRQTR